MSADKTPVMAQHAAAKRAYADAVLFFRLGDFYEMFGDDAVLAARLLDLTLTSRNKGKPDEVPMAGVPHHAAHSYIARLLELGHKVAICEQMADPSKVKGIVPREVVRVVTPGLITERDQLDATTNNWLAALDVEREQTGVALLDLSTGELLAARLCDATALLAELARRRPRELLIGFSGEMRDDRGLASALGAVLPQAALREDPELTELAEALGALAADAEHVELAARRAVARVLRFAKSCNPGAELPLKRITHWDPSRELLIDSVAQTHLELVQSVSGNRAATLLGVLDVTRTPPGARLLRSRLLGPLGDVERIRRRQDL